MENTADLILNAIFRIIEAVAPDATEAECADYTDAQGIYMSYEDHLSADLGCSFPSPDCWSQDPTHLGY